MGNDPAYFTWYELITTDVAAAAAFYRGVVGWGTEEAWTSRLPYTLFTAGGAPTAGLMELPEEGRKLGAMPRWVGYVGVRDVHATAGQIKRLGRQFVCAAHRYQYWPDFGCRRPASRNICAG